jgi:iron complex transport system substrate-binding protein
MCRMKIRRVFPAGPPASVTLFTVAPEKRVGWTRAPTPDAQPFLPTRYAELPEIGRLTGRGNTVNLESVVQLAPDLVLDVGSTTATYVSLADQVQEQTHIPAVLIGGRLAEAAATLRTVRGLLGVPERAEALARYAETVVGAVQKAVAKIPPKERPSVYVARGPRGLETAVAGSIRSEVVDLVGARNVVDNDTGTKPKEDRRTRVEAYAAAVLTLRGQISGEPSGVADQSLARMCAPISPPPASHAGAARSAPASIESALADWAAQSSTFS